MNDVLARVLPFFESIGLKATPRRLAAPTFLPGVTLDGAELVYDVERLSYPGDLLHEAGHLAFTPPDERAMLSSSTTFNPGDDFAAIAWSYAALTHLELAPAIVFHEGGYGGWSPAYIENFAAGRYVGVSLLEWAGLCLEPKRGRTAADTYPKMMKWLRD